MINDKKTETARIIISTSFSATNHSFQISIMLNYSDTEVKCNLDKEKTKYQLIAAFNAFSINEKNSAKRAKALSDIRFSFYSIRNGRHHSTKVIDIDHANSLVKYLIATTIKEYIGKEEIVTVYIEENDLKLGEAWDILSMLLDPSLNGLGDELLTNLETRDLELSQLALNLAVRHLSSRQFLQKGWNLSADYCLGFLVKFNQLNGSRQLIMGRTPDLIKNLIGIVKLWISAGNNPDRRAMDKVHIPIVSSSLSCLINLLGRCLTTDLHNACTILSNGGFQVAEKGLPLSLKLYHNAPPSEQRDYNLLLSRSASFLNVVAMLVVSTYDLSHGSHADIAQKEVDYIVSTLRDEGKRDVMARALATVIETVPLDVGLGTAVIQAIVAYSRASHKYGGVTAMLAFLQFRLNLSSPNLMVLLMRLRRNPEIGSCKEYVLDFMAFAGTVSVVLDAIIDNELDGCMNVHMDTTTERDVRHCSYPGCMIHSALLMGNRKSTLKVCSGCKKVHYCSAEHQKGHWKAHKPHCNAPSST